MLKSTLLALSGSAVAIAAIPQITHSNPLDNRDLSCYMETSSGQVLNLSQLCGDATRPAATPAASPAAAPVSAPTRSPARPPSLNNGGFSTGSPAANPNLDPFLSGERLSENDIVEEPYFTPVIPIYEAAASNGSRLNGNSGQCVVLDAQGRRCP
ncbi:MAG: hypothetical protein Fur0046_06300 [Cyanobacteria bacterium J069]|nr:MAG: hypothetical protein D6742_05275 [Cyanobacteria bacterium J069]